MDDVLITPAQIRAARGLLGWSQEQLAHAAKVGVSTVKDIEAGKRDPIASNLDAIKRALENGGAKFIPSNGDGPGVRLAGHRPQVIRKPTRKAFDETIPFRVAWRNQKVIVFIPRTVLEDLDRTVHDDDAAFVASFHRHEKLILDKTAAAIDAGRATQDGHLRLQASDFFG
jgi:transcriptional regulator with XRE-family HTH domain